MHKVIVPENLKSAVTAFFTGKDPGASSSAVADMLRIRQDRIYLPLQKHTDKIIILESSIEPKVGDAVLTHARGMLIGVQVADCVPVLLYDSRQHVVGAIHAGWRGTAGSILKKTVAEISRRFAGSPEHIMVAIGPSISSCCYAVGPDVCSAVISATGEGSYHRTVSETHYLDLASANRMQALSAGIPEQNIWVSGECTFCNPETFYSFRYSKGSNGRQGAFIGII